MCYKVYFQLKYNNFLCEMMNFKLKKRIEYLYILSVWLKNNVINV